MAQKTSFLDKVYDVYENIDFASYQQDNLNPVREVKPSIATKSNEDRARDIIASRFQEIQEELRNFGIIEEEEEDVITASANGETLPDDKTSQEINNFITAGTSPESSFILGDPLSGTGIDPDPLALSIEKLIMEVTVRLNPTDPSKLNTTGGIEVPDLVSPPEVDCGDRQPATSGGASPTSLAELKKKNEKEKKEGKKDDPEVTSNNSEESWDPESGGGDPSGGNGNPSDDDDPYGTDAALELVTINEAIKDQEEDATILQCAAVELGFLKVILTILRVISILKKIVSYALNIAYTVSDIVQLAAGAWLNPTNIGKIIQRVLGRVMAIIQELISNIIKMIWDLLNLDCLSAMTQGYIDQINAALAGINQLKATINVNSVSSGWEGLAKKTEEMTQAYENSYNELKKAMESTDSEFSKLKDTFSASSLLDKLKESSLNGVEEGWNPDGGEMVKNIVDTSKDIAKNTVNVFAINRPGVTLIGAESDSE